MSERRRHSTGTKYELRFGYSRAIRVGGTVKVAGTAGLRPDGQVVSDDIVEQMRRAIDIMSAALEELDAKLSDVVMTRIYVSDVRNIDRVAVIHSEVFRDIQPASSIVKVDFIDPKILVEIEAEAIVEGK